MKRTWSHAARVVIVTAGLCVLAGGLFEGAHAQPKPEGEMRWALYVTLSPVWFDPGDVIGQITPSRGWRC